MPSLTGHQYRRKALALFLGRWQVLEGTWCPKGAISAWQSHRVLLPGWYRFRVVVSGDQQRYRLQLRRGAEAFVQMLPLRNGVERLRIVRVSSGQAMHLQLEFPYLSGAVRSLEVRYQPLFTPMAYYRFMRTLRTRHGFYSRLLGSNRSVPGPRAWLHYNELLARRHSDAEGYSAWMATVEAGRSQQIDNQLCPSVSFAPWSPTAVGCPDWWLVSDEGCVMAPQAEARVADLLAKHPQLELIYADSDLLGAHGRRYSPQWKPAWNLDLLYSDPHYSRCFWVRADRCAIAQQGLQAAGESPSLYALLLELGELIPPSCIGHWPEVLSHHRPEPRASEDSAALLQRHLLRHGQRAEVELIDPELGHRLEWSLPLEPIRVSVIVPTRDRVQLLRACLDSLWATTESALQLEVLVVDNGSEDPATHDYLRQLELAGKARILRCPGAFNYSALNNAAAAQANGELLLLLNNDIEAIKEGWLKKMAGQALRPEIGCVGAQLLYPDSSLQHAGVILGIGGVAGHSHKYMQHEHPGHQGRIQISHNLSAVTGAVLMIRRQLFAELGGLDADHLHVSYNDIDLCLRAMAAGYRNIYCADAVLVHHESRSRGAPTTRQAMAQWRAERQIMKDRWGELLHADPAYHPQLSLTEENFSLRLDGPPPAVRFGAPAPEAEA